MSPDLLPVYGNDRQDLNFFNNNSLTIFKNLLNRHFRTPPCMPGEETFHFFIFNGIFIMYPRKFYEKDIT